MKASRWCWLGLLLALSLGTWLRAPAVWSRPLWFDEADTWRSAAPRADITYRQFFRWTNHFENAPLGYLLTRLSIDVAGNDSETVMRQPQLWLGVACIPAAFAMGWVACGPWTGVFMALLVAVDPNMVDQSQQCRMYTPLGLFTILAATWCIVLLRAPTRCKWNYLAVGVLMGLCLWSSLLGVMAWGGLGLGVALYLMWGLARPSPETLANLAPDAPPRAWIKPLVSGFALAVVVAILTAQVGFFQVFYNMKYPRRPSGLSVSQILVEVVTAAKDLIYPQSKVSLLLYPVAAAGVLLVARRSRAAFTMAVGMAAATGAMLILFRKQHHFMDPRYFLTAQPAIWLGLAALASSAFPRPDAHPGDAPTKVRPLALAACALVCVYIGFQAWQCTHIDRWWQQPDKYELGKAMIRVRGELKPGEAVALNPQVTDILANYYQLPVDETIDHALYENYKPRPFAEIPESFNAPAAWVVIGMVNDNPRLDPKDPRYAGAAVLALAKHYKLDVTDKDIAPHLRRDRVSVARVTAEGVEWR